MSKVFFNFLLLGGEYTWLGPRPHVWDWYGLFILALVPFNGMVLYRQWKLAIWFCWWWNFGNV